MQEALERVELKIAFLERANSELSDVVYRQQQELERLAARVRELSERLSSAPDGGEARGPDDERPPHY
jgi:SlyX protein